MFRYISLKNERGWKTASAIGVFVSLFAYASGYALNKMLLLTGILA